jgi:hypothetical protein
MYNNSFTLTSAPVKFVGPHHALATLTLEFHPVPIVQEAGCVSGPGWVGVEIFRPHQHKFPGQSSP